LSLTELLEAGSHFGHQVKRWHPKMDSYIWQARDGVHIFDLAKTRTKLQEACLAVRDLVSGGGTIVFVGTKRQAQAIIKEEAENLGIPYVSNRWLGGTITNWSQIKKRLDKLAEMRESREKGEYEKYTKKENILINRQINRLERDFGGLKDLSDIPEAIFVVDCKREEVAVKEAIDRGVKVFGLVDTNCDPDGIDHLIPANDDAVRSIKLIVSKFAEAVKDGLEWKKKKENKK
jgi:small subunit ribosomal protein S2